MSTEFYRQDIEVLEALGHEVVVATSLREVPRDTELVFLWWWSWLWLVGPVLKARGLPICVTGSLEPDIYEKRSWIYRKLVSWGLRFADRSVFVSQYMIDRLSTMVRLTDPRLCPHIVMDEYAVGNSTNQRSDPDVVLNVAWQTQRNMRRKMLPQLVDAFALVLKKRPQARLVLAGEPMDGGPLLKEQAERLGIQHAVEFCGKLSKEEKIRRMQTCGVYYQCSRHEGFGVAIAEAMACGAPVVVNRKTAIPEVVGDCGYYVDDDTVESIAAKILETLENPEQARLVGLSAAERINVEFRFARRRDYFEQILAELAPRDSGPRGSGVAMERRAA